jgi:hypothetical protein
MSDGPERLPAPAEYFPIARGVYGVTAGLRPFGTDFGNGPADRRVFQIDDQFSAFRESKLACRRDRLSKYLAASDFSPAVERAVVGWFADRLTAEHPNLFEADAGGNLNCRLTGDSVGLSENAPPAGYVSVIDALANQVAEDVCVVRNDGTRDWLAFGHVFSPGHWSIDRKIGLDFAAVHEPVPGIEKINRSAAAFVSAMVHRPPAVRFAWGFGTDDRLNHHPDPPAGVDPAAWRGRSFDPANPRFFLRIERQITWGLPAVSAAVFVIRVFHLSGESIRADPVRRELLKSALLSMSPQALRYKGLAGSVDAVVEWLGSA